eukprot:scaffold641_cov373-Pavlova_lutheri.AAC.17
MEHIPLAPTPPGCPGLSTRSRGRTSFPRSRAYGSSSDGKGGGIGIRKEHHGMRTSTVARRVRASKRDTERSRRRRCALPCSRAGRRSTMPEMGECDAPDLVAGSWLGILGTGRSYGSSCLHSFRHDGRPSVAIDPWGTTRRFRPRPDERRGSHVGWIANVAFPFRPMLFRCNHRICALSSPACVRTGALLGYVRRVHLSSPPIGRIVLRSSVVGRGSMGYEHPKRAGSIGEEEGFGRSDPWTPLGRPGPKVGWIPLRHTCSWWIRGGSWIGPEPIDPDRSWIDRLDVPRMSPSAHPFDRSLHLLPCLPCDVPILAVSYTLVRLVHPPIPLGSVRTV